MRTGDIVRHISSGHTWAVGAATADSIFPLGRPTTWADRSKCEMIRAASDEEHARTVRSVLIDFDRKRDDPRYHHNKDIAIALGIGRHRSRTCKACRGTGLEHEFELIR